MQGIDIIQFSDFMDLNMVIFISQVRSKEDKNFVLEGVNVQQQHFAITKCMYEEDKTFKMDFILEVELKLDIHFQCYESLRLKGYAIQIDALLTFIFLYLSKSQKGFIYKKQDRIADDRCSDLVCFQLSNNLELRK